MTSPIVLSLLLTAVSADTFLRLCPQDPSSSSSSIPDCVSRSNRRELRELTDEERTWLVDAFRKERAVAPRQQWQHILDPPGVYQLIRRLDTRLASRRLALPYWDAAIELRLTQPGDSILFHPSFLLRSRRRSSRRVGPLSRPAAKLERRIRNPRDDKSLRRLQSQRTRKLLKAIRRNKQSELLFLLYEMGDLFTRIAEPLACPSLLPHISCTYNSSSPPLPLLAPSARCAHYLPTDLCHRSTCLSDLCTVVLTAPTLPPTVPSPTVSIDNSTIPDSIDNSTLVDLSTVSGQASLSDVTSIPIDAVTLLLSSHESTPPPLSLLVSKDHKPKQNGWYKIRRERKDKKDKSSTSAPKKREKVARQAPDNSDEDAPAFRFPLKTKTIDHTVEKTGQRPRHVQMDTESKAEIPQVFIPITVITGPWRGAHRIKSAPGANVTIRGLNSPIGYTTTRKGRQATNTPGIFTIQVPDPDLAGPLVEFEVNVADQNGNRCEQFCYIQKSSTYKPCTRGTVRISQFSDFSDVMHWNKTEEDAISSQTTGKGYYRKKFTHLLFSCPSNY